MVSHLVERVTALRLPKLKPRRGNVCLLCLVLFYLVFLVVGAAIFSAIEAPVEVGLIRSTRRLKQKFLRDNPCVTGEPAPTVASVFVALVAVIMKVTVVG